MAPGSRKDGGYVAVPTTPRVVTRDRSAMLLESAKRSSSHRQIHALRRTRDPLQPRLLSGQVELDTGT